VNTRALLWHQYRYDQKEFWREPASVFFTVALPLIFLFIFVSIFGNEPTEVDGHTVSGATYYVPGILALAIVSATIVNLAICPRQSLPRTTIPGDSNAHEPERRAGTPRLLMAGVRRCQAVRARVRRVTGTASSTVAPRTSPVTPPRAVRARWVTRRLTATARSTAIAAPARS
jgi:hypothetical protein